VLTANQKIRLFLLAANLGPAVNGIGLGITHPPFVSPGVSLLLSAARGSACDHVPWLPRRYHVLILASAVMSLHPWRRTSKRRAQNARQVMLPKTIWIEIESGKNDDFVTRSRSKRLSPEATRRSALTLNYIKFWVFSTRHMT
jgi:hypothetical protein